MLTEQILKEYHGKRGAGILPICSSTKRLLVALRSYDVEEPGTWGIFGGKIESDEANPMEAAKREFMEEAGYSGSIQLIKAYLFKDRREGFSYQNYLGIINKEFSPHLNWESEDAKWLTLSELKKLSPKHFGLNGLLKNSNDLIQKYCGEEDLIERILREGL